MSYKFKLIFLRDLLCYGLCGVVKLGESIFIGYALRHAVGYEFLAQTLAERLCHREEHPAVGHGVALYIVEVAVRVRAVVIV